MFFFSFYCSESSKLNRTKKIDAEPELLMKIFTKLRGALSQGIYLSQSPRNKAVNLGQLAESNNSTAQQNR